MTALPSDRSTDTEIFRAIETLLDEIKVLVADGLGMRTTASSVGTGGEQTIAHLLGVVPKAVNIVATGANAVVPAYRADATNIYPTVPLGEPYVWSAEA
jgi:hypothetical protein